MAMVRNSVGAGRCDVDALSFYQYVHSHLHFSQLPPLKCVCVCVFSDCYVADELVVSRAGRRVRVGNTDAEGRMVMVDLLCEMKEKVLL